MFTKATTADQALKIHVDKMVHYVDASEFLCSDIPVVAEKAWGTKWPWKQAWRLSVDSTAWSPTYYDVIVTINDVNNNMSTTESVIEPPIW